MTLGEGATCACCGYRTLVEGADSSETCAVCWWENDPVQLAAPLLQGGSNTVSLAEGQLYFISAGVSDPRFTAHVRAPAANEADPDWRPLETGRDMQVGPIMADAEPYWLKS